MNNYKEAIDALKELRDTNGLTNYKNDMKLIDLLGYDKVDKEDYLELLYEVDKEVDIIAPAECKEVKQEVPKQDTVQGINIIVSVDSMIRYLESIGYEVKEKGYSGCVHSNDCKFFKSM